MCAAHYPGYFLFFTDAIVYIHTYIQTYIKNWVEFTDLSYPHRTSLISFFVAVIAVTASGILSPQYLGLALTYSFQLNETTKTLVI